MSATRSSPAARAQRRAADRERMQQAAMALLASEGWQRWVSIRARNGLSRYSFHNQLLIALQRPEASYVAGFKAFLELERCVRKGEKAIRILAPMSVRCAERDRDDGEGTESRQGTARRTVFRAVPVFDVSQTEPLPGSDPPPLGPPCEPIEGESHAHLLGALTRLAGELGYTVSREPTDAAADGWCDAKRKAIAVNSAISANAQVRVLIHEIAHALGVGYREYGRERAEVLVDTVTFIVCGSLGLDISGSSVPYVAGWGEDGALEAIRAYAQTIDTIAKRIETALAPPAGPAPATGA